MTESQKNMLFIAVAAVLMVGGYLAWDWYSTQKQTLNGELKKYKRELKQAQALQRQSDQYATDMQWLDKYAPKEPLKEGNLHVQSKLEELVAAKIRSKGLKEKKKMVLLPEDKERNAKSFYSTAVLSFSVTGNEERVYDLLRELSDATQSRAIIELEMRPQPDDKTQVDCSATVCQWYKPKFVGE